MAPTRSTPSVLDGPGAATRRCTRPRPGHADLAGMQKYGFDDARPVLERASARETAARVALGDGRRGVPAAGARRRGGQPRRRHRPGRGPDGRRCRGPADLRPDRRRPGALRRPGDQRARWSPRSTTRRRTATPSAASSRSSCTACRRAWAATCTGTAGSTPGWPAPSWAIQSVKGVEVGDGFDRGPPPRLGGPRRDRAAATAGAAAGPPTGPAASRAA